MKQKKNFFLWSKSQESEISSFLEKFRIIKKEEADKEAMQIVARVMPRIAAESVGEYTSELIDIPDESFKGKLIGREGRNINYWEKITGVELSSRWYSRSSKNIMYRTRKEIYRLYDTQEIAKRRTYQSILYREVSYWSSSMVSMKSS
jgi:hypothetical protein